MEKINVSFDEINFYARTIADRLKEEGITHVVGLARGGLIPATIMSYVLDVPLLSYAISSYENTTKTDKFKVHQFVHFNDLKSLKEADPHVLVVDDICDTGGTLIKAVNTLMEHEVKDVICVITHGIFSGPALNRINNCTHISRIIVSNSLPQEYNKSKCTKIEVFDISKLIGEVIKRIYTGDSVSTLF